MKKLIAWFLVLAMCVSMFAACGQEATPTTTPTEAPTQATVAPTEGEVVDLSDPEGLAAALEYLKTIYKNAGGLTPKDFTRIGTVPVGTKKFEVVWTASVGEDLVKAVRGEDGMVTIDVNEECDTETPYTLTATLTDEAGNSVSYAWEHTLPASLNMGEILEQAYALEAGASLPYEVTLTGTVISVDTLWSDQYGNITVTLAVEGHEDKPVQCYRLAGDGAKDLAVGDTITVTGTITNYKGLIEFAQGCTLDTRISGGGSAPVPVEYTAYQPFPNGQKVVIYNIKYGVALSEKKAGYYNAGVKKSSYGATEVWTAVLHSDGTYSFVNADGEALGLDKEYSSMNLGAKYDRWKIVRLECGKFLIENTDREGYFMEWYADKSNFSTYNYHSPEKDPQYIMNFILLDDEDVPEVVKPDTTMVPEMVTSPETGVAYKLYVVQGNMKDKVLYFTGKTANASYYLATTEDYKEAVDVFVEEVEGGSRLYFMDGDNKVYIDAFANGKYFNARLTGEPTAVFSYDSKYDTYVANLNGTDCYIGTYNTFDTLSVSKYDYISTSFPAHLGTLVEAEAPGEEEGGEESTMTLEEQLAAASALANGQYLEQTTSIVGNVSVINSAYSSQYNNITFTVDVDGTSVYCYRVNGEGMDTLKVGDVVKVEGNLTAYNGSAQFDKTATVKVLSLADQLADASALANGEYLTYKTYIEGKVSVINSAYSSQYNNITFTVDVDGTSVYCYRVNGEGMDTLKVGDVVKVEGKLTAYNGNAQFDKTASVTVVPAAGGEEGGETEDTAVGITITFDDKAKRTEFDTTKQVWVENGITVTNEKAASTNNVGDYADPARFYKGSSLKVEAEGMTKIEFNCDDYKDTYVNDLVSSITADGFEATADGLVVTVVFAEEVDSFSISSMAAQVRVDSITVYTAEAGESGGETEDTAEAITITFDDKAKRTEFDTTKQVWVENGITVTNEKASSSSNVGDYADPARFYKGSSLKVEAKGMTKIQFNCDDYKDTYVNDLVSSITADGFEATADGLVVTVVFEEAVDSFSISAMAAQVRVDSITVYAA